MAAPSSRATQRVLVQIVRGYSTKGSKHYKLVIAGGGTGGCAIAARACRSLGKGKVAVIEPNSMHYNQPLWTLVGAGIKKVEQSGRPMDQVLPSGCVHYKEKVGEFDPPRNVVTLGNGEEISYDFLVIALGIQITPQKIEGLMDALNHDPQVCSNYYYKYCAKTFPAIQNFQGGNAIFTFPNTPIKCAGAPQKIMYLADEYWRKQDVRNKGKVMYNTSLPVIFGVKHYAKSLLKVVERKNIKVNYRHNLKSIDYKNREATFDLLDSENGETKTFSYDFLHIAPPMAAPQILQSTTSKITDDNGFLSVNKHTMQHTKYLNIFGIGDCTNVPTSKSAAAVACQNKILHKGLHQAMKGQSLNGKYDGYTSCPLLTGYKSCILAEFDYNLEPLETFPINQSKERRTMFHMKKDVMPQIYWRMLLKGHWAGPGFYRRAMHLWMSR